MTLEPATFALFLLAVSWWCRCLSRSVRVQVRVTTRRPIAME